MNRSRFLLLLPTSILAVRSSLAGDIDLPALQRAVVRTTRGSSTPLQRTARQTRQHRLRGRTRGGDGGEKAVCTSGANAGKAWFPQTQAVCWTLSPSDDPNL